MVGWTLCHELIDVRSTQHAIVIVLHSSIVCVSGHCVSGGGMCQCAVPLPVQVTTTPVHVRPTHLLLSLKRCTAFNSTIRKMAILINTFIRQMALAVLVVFLSLSSLLHEEMLASSPRKRRGQKAASSPGTHDGWYGKSILYH